MNWNLKTYDELTKDELYDILKLRCQVFVEEQKCTEADLDDKDKSSIHLFAEDQGQTIACLRILPAGLSYPEASIGRFAIDKAYRGQGLGREAMNRTIQYMKQEMKVPAIRISGQAYLQKFYEDFGFVTIRGPYLEDQIPHYEMLKLVSKT